MYSFAGKLMDFLTDSISDPNLDPAQIDIGAIAVDSQPGAYTEFTVTLPRATAA